MAGFINRITNNPFVDIINDNLKKLSDLGMKYGDMVVKQSKAIGVTEAEMSTEGPMPQDMLYSLAMADIGDKKYIAFFDKDYKTKREFLRKFAMNGEIEWILDTITDESIIFNEKNFFCRPDVSSISPNLSEKMRDKVIDAIEKNFKKIYTHFFKDQISAWYFFKQFLIEGFLCFEIIYDEEAKNIIGFKELDPISLRPGVEEDQDGWKNVWYQYEDSPKLKRKLMDSQIIYISYSKSSFIGRVSYTERLVRSFNLLRLMENTRVIWNLMNATYRLKMVVPIGTKSPQKAKEALQELVSAYKEDVYLDFDSGELLINGKPSMQFYKNYLMPKNAQGDSPEIETLSAEGPDLSRTESLKYFYDKLKMDSKIPWSRFDREEGNGTTIMLGADGLDRDEIRFANFISRLRSIFQEIILKPLWIQLTLDFPELKDDEIFRSNLGIKFYEDNLFKEFKRIEIVTKKLEFINGLRDYTKDDASTPYFSSTWLLKHFDVLESDELKENDIFLNKNKDDDKDAADASSDGFSFT